MFPPPSRCLKKHDSGRPPLEPGLSERSLDSVTMQSIATTASMFSSGSGSTRSGESADELRELERRRSSLQTESAVALKIDLAESRAETEAANLALASARRLFYIYRHIGEYRIRVI